MWNQQLLFLAFLGDNCFVSSCPDVAKPIPADSRHEAKPSEIEATSATRTHRRQPIPASLSRRNPGDRPAIIWSLDGRLPPAEGRGMGTGSGGEGGRAWLSCCGLAAAQSPA